MTMISRLGFIPTRHQTLISENLKTAQEITIVVPVKQNQRGINLFLKEFFKTHSRENFPHEIIIVDNNSCPAIQIQQDNYPIEVRLLRCTKVGPASARNLGVANSKTDWILFTDSDCVPTKSLLTGYLHAQNGSIGYAGNIKAHGKDLISKYYEEQEILLPPKVYELGDTPRPNYLITANCLVWKKAFVKAGGFNEQIKIAGGEDIDLGFKLLGIGQLSYAFESLAMHSFERSLGSFRERFKRYGYGNKLISEFYQLDLKPRIFRPQNPTLINHILAFLQFFWLSSGYNDNRPN